MLGVGLATLLEELGFAVPVYLGAGSNAQTWGSPIPLRRPIITVVGDPIKCPRIDQPTQEEIDDLKLLYIDRLKAIFSSFASDPTSTLTIEK